MSALWLGIILACAAAALLGASWRRQIPLSDLGTVSQQWLAEHRAHDRHQWER